MTRPLSQTGFHRIPKNPMHRGFTEGGVPVKRAGKLDAINEKLAELELTMHPTKGIRRVSLRRMRAQMIMAEIFSGQRRYDTASIAAALKAAEA